MGYIPPAVDHVARKIARTQGVEQSFVCRDGAIDAIIEGGYNRELRSHLLEIGMRSMVPVRVFYRMPDGRAIGESEAEEMGEAVEDFYTTIKVAGFAGEPAQAPPDEVAGDAYGDKDVSKNKQDRDKWGQLKLQRIRAGSRGRPVVGWQYGDNIIRKGSKIKFKKHACLQWKDGKTFNAKPGMKGKVHALSSRRALVYLSLGGHEKIELPVHAVGHVYDVMVDPKLESAQYSETELTTALPTELKRLVMAIGFGRPPGENDTKKNTAHFKGPAQPDLHGYAGVEEDPEEDMLNPPSSKPEQDGPETKTKVTVKGGRVVDPTTRGAKKAPVMLGRK